MFVLYSVCSSVKDESFRRKNCRCVSTFLFLEAKVLMTRSQESLATQKSGAKERQAQYNTVFLGPDKSLQIHFSSIFSCLSDIECPEFDISDVHLESRMDGRKIGAQVHFTCPRGFDLRGQNRLICQKNGNNKLHFCSLKGLKYPLPHF